MKHLNTFNENNNIDLIEEEIISILNEIIDSTDADISVDYNLVNYYTKIMTIQISDGIISNITDYKNEFLHLISYLEYNKYKLIEVELTSDDDNFEHCPKCYNTEFIELDDDDPKIDWYSLDSDSHAIICSKCNEISTTSSIYSFDTSLDKEQFISTLNGNTPLNVYDFSEINLMFKK